LSNIILVPICMISMVMGVLSVLFGCTGAAAEIQLDIAEVLNDFVMKISAYLAGLSWTHASTDSEILLFALFSGVILVICCQIWLKSRKLTSISVIFVLVMICLSVWIENAYQAKDLKIAVLGRGTSCLLAIRQDGDAILIDVTGDSYGANYASVYLEQTGIRNAEMLYLCNPKIRSIQKYDAYLTFFNTKELWLMKQTEQKMPDLSGAETHITNEKEFLFHGAKIRISEKQIQIRYAGKLFICTNEKTEIPEIPDILTVYGKSENVQPECGFLLIPDGNTCYLPDAHTYVNENNLEVTISENGFCRVRRLYGGA